jgi:hypothetical protein
MTSAGIVMTGVAVWRRASDQNKQTQRMALK